MVKFSLTLLIIAATPIIIKFLLSQLERKKANKVLSQYEEDSIILFSSNANFFGKKSAGVMQIRGNGVLLLTSEELYFQMWFPKKELRIPISSIENVEEVASFLGKTKSRLLLKVDYKTEADKFDSCAWLVGNLEEWKEKLRSLI